ncbi:sodium/proton antiporter, CPA1 family [Marivirga sericea]|uniref:Sodium/proton antiporter, CPA1 family n=1 Tax=Marivirga sericea TaxID=1028 RepID=A0A1X7L441_9BACT|nr:sodium:proton antiporter [Marivirga sericea]SMG48636.1 sodium/proton antiporter, CPA1 family [Marivirga sericea]
MGVLDLITLLIFLAAVFTFINVNYLKLPSTIGLMIIALVLSVLILLLGYIFPEITDLAISIVSEFDFKEVLLDVMLSFLLFAGALSINVKRLKEERWPILIFATVGVLISTFVVGFLMFYIFAFFGYQIDLIYCLLFGALISPTDPIAVLALLSDAKVSKKLEIKIAGESLFNDGIGVVAFLTILGLAQTGVENFSLGGTLGLFGVEVGGGLLLGAIFGFLGLKLLEIIDNDHVELEVLVTLSLVMVSYKAAEFLHISGPLAVVVLGLFLSKEGHAVDKSKATGDYVYKFWHLVDEALNAILFILIGLEIIVISKEFHPDYFLIGLCAIVVVLFARLIGVGIPVKIMERLRTFEKNTLAILTWGGLRGGISVALALSIPDDFEAKNIILSATYSVVVFSILVQGLTIKKLVPKKS